VINNGTQGFIQVQASQRIIVMRRLYYDCLGQDPLYPFFYWLKG
jgi:hypothetical protein